MGTGSFGNGGSGALGRGGSGSAAWSGGAASGSVGSREFFDWRSKARGNPALANARSLIRETFAHRNVAAFVQGTVTSAQVRGCYEELFRVSVLLVQQQSWNAIERAYHVASSPGCLAELAEAIIRRHAVGGMETHREIARSATLDVLLAAIGEDDELFLRGSAADVFKKVKPQVFASLSGHFLGSVIHRSALRELPALREEEALVVHQATQERANFVIRAFENSWLHKRFGDYQVSYRHLLRVAADKGDWFEGKLREEIAE